MFTIKFCAVFVYFLLFFVNCGFCNFTNESSVNFLNRSTARPILQISEQNESSTEKIELTTKLWINTTSSVPTTTTTGIPVQETTTNLPQIPTENQFDIFKKLTTR